ncbi:TPA: nucleoside triphosphate pyrophosphohydrolase [Candidatus Marinimicrobia bacterium]|nr:MAG: MazG family protein [Marinimicrobia bacterium 46_43]HAE87578.1 nucleoside triphosphate pyrophosphohydrolase [Candidatus Neomarinimicrobiota bacterium]HBY18147.1 nucleoside triphosphate pyrophosphohydrolase [Candidatus Neomarinimicrobiota bacterium]
MKEFSDLVEIIKKLRSPEGCPWDREQTPESLIPFMIEEVYEVIDALDHRNDRDLVKELGDVMLHLVFQAVLAEEDNRFTIRDVLLQINHKMISRHPHVFTNKVFKSEEEIHHYWEKKKKAEGRKRLLDGIPNELPSLHKAYRVQSKASMVGFDWDKIHDVWEKIREEVRELEDASREKDAAAMEMEFGDLLFSLVNVGRFMGINADEALRKSTDKFIRRFHRVEEMAERNKTDLRALSLDELENMWQQVKDEDDGIME